MEELEPLAPVELALEELAPAVLVLELDSEPDEPEVATAGTELEELRESVR